MINSILLLYSFWFLRISKHVLFWLYLWQLKEYHVGRFLDHFNTYKGKKLIFNPLLISKIILVVLFLLSDKTFSYLSYILLLLYSAEFIFFLRAIFVKTAKTPKITFKTIFLTVVSFIVLILFLLFTFFLFKDILWASISLLVFDILTPLIISLVVLLFQPFFVFLRNRVLVKAKKKIRGFKNLTVIGITGSYGKTSTKEFLTTILSKKFKTLSTKNHQNSEIGIANCILNYLKPEHEIFVVEMGSYNKGGIKLLCDMVGPKIGIVTGVNEQHLALFGSLKNLLSAEGGIELAASLPKDGLLVLNGENKYCLDLYKKDNFSVVERKKIYSINRDKISSDIWTEDITVAKDYISFLTINTERELAHFQVNVLGKHNIQNILAAVLVAKELGMDFEEIARASNDIRQEQAGMILKKGQRNINIIDSSYSSNPDGVIADLDYLSIFPNKRVIVMPCLIELGDKSEEIHKKLGEKIGKTCDIAIITTKDRFEDIKMGAMKVGMKGKSIVLYENSKDIYSMIMLFCKEGDTILLEGRVPGSLIKMLI
ncbi:MAG: UDP-N-acetylmuramoyl-tripeptide--D-alanyl-D-alanine ligase [bacterium]|nr:UDP-N-acetylmuramoyl-tripeptide--D-alanyl-D-alanine ligase [bacterium]